MDNSILYTFHDIYLLIKKNLYFVIKLSISFLFLGFLYIFFSTKYYDSYISIYPASESENTMNNIMGVGSVLGLDLGQNSSTAFYIPDVINSTRLKRDIVNNKWNFLKKN